MPAYAAFLVYKFFQTRHPSWCPTASDGIQQAIEAVIRKHAVVHQLVDNGWLYLWRLCEAG